MFSPLQGTVLEKYVEQGEFVSIGKPLFKVADTNKMFMRAYITSEQLKALKLDKKQLSLQTMGTDKRNNIMVLLHGYLTALNSHQRPFLPMMSVQI